MRVLLVHNFYQIRGGEDVVLEQEMELLQRSGLELRLFAIHNSEIRGVMAKLVTGLCTIYNPWSRRDLAREIRRFRPDIVHVHNFFPRLSPSIFDACKRAGVPSVMTIHNLRLVDPCAAYGATTPDPRTPRRSPWSMLPKRSYRGSLSATLALAAMVEMHRWRGTLLKKVDAYIALSNDAKALLVARGLPAEKVHVKPNSTPVPASGHAPTIRSGALFVGRLNGQKGVRTLLEAWENVDAPLTIIGDGPLSDMVASTANPRITFAGPQPRAAVAQAMRSAQFLVFPSLAHEMFPMTIAEAFAHQLPVLASALPSLRDLVIHKENGLLFEPGDPASLAAWANWAMANPAQLNELSRMAHAQYLERYTPEVNAASLIGIYRSLIGVTPGEENEEAQPNHAGTAARVTHAS